MFLLNSLGLGGYLHRFKRFQWVTGLKSRHASLAPAAGMCAEHSLELLLK